jgi:hypothetical protein
MAVCWTEKRLPLTKQDRRKNSAQAAAIAAADVPAAVAADSVVVIAVAAVETVAAAVVEDTNKTHVLEKL